jgi:hypothetical protein
MSEKSPWWQTTKTVRQGLWLGCGFALLGLSELVLAGTGRVNLPMLITGAGFSAIGLAHLTSAVTMRKGQRSSSAQDGHPTMRDSTPPTF